MTQTFNKRVSWNHLYMLLNSDCQVYGDETYNTNPILIYTSVNMAGNILLF